MTFGIDFQLHFILLHVYERQQHYILADLVLIKTGEIFVQLDELNSIIKA